MATTEQIDLWYKTLLNFCCKVRLNGKDNLLGVKNKENKEIKLFCGNQLAQAHGPLLDVVAILPDLIRHLQESNCEVQGTGIVLSPRTGSVPGKAQSKPKTADKTDVGAKGVKIDELEKQLATEKKTRGELELKVKQLEEQIENTKQKEELRKKCEELQEAPNKATSEEKSEPASHRHESILELESLKAQNAVLEHAKQELEAKLENSDKQSKELENQIKQLKSEIASLKIEKESLQSAQSQQALKREDSDTRKRPSSSSASQKTRELIIELQTVKRENDQLKKYITDLNKKLEESSNRLEEQRKQFKTTLETKENEINIRDRLNNNGTKYVLLEELTSLFNHKKLDKVVEQLAAKNAENIDRLAAEMRAKIGNDECSLENISIKFRPMNVAEEYNLLCSNAWLEAKGALDDQQEQDETALKCLCKILMVAYSATEEVFEKRMDGIADALFGAPKDGKKKQELTTNLKTQVGDSLRGAVEHEDMEPIIKIITAKMAEDKCYKKHKDIEAVNTYLVQCAKLSWKMVLQRPPMVFATPGVSNKFDNQAEIELSWDSQPANPGAVVEYYISPIMKHGEKLMVKGRALVK